MCQISSFRGLLNVTKVLILIVIVIVIVLGPFVVLLKALLVSQDQKTLSLFSLCPDKLEMLIYLEVGDFILYILDKRLE